MAKEEAWQKSGREGSRLEKSAGAYEYDEVLDKGEIVRAQVRVHLILVSRTEERFPEKGQRTLRWCSPAEAAEAIDETDLKRLFEKVPDEVGKLLRRGFQQGRIIRPAVDLFLEARCISGLHADGLHSYDGGSAVNEKQPGYAVGFLLDQSSPCFGDSLSRVSALAATAAMANTKPAPQTANQPPDCQTTPETADPTAPATLSMEG